jgi:hypothetical protein
VTAALIIGTVIALIAVGFVLVPLFRDELDGATPAAPASVAASPPADDAVGALREIEFDRATGKLSDADYAVLKARYTTEALEAMRAAESGAITPEAADLAEEAILRYRNRAAVGCAVCGPRPEPDALYCSTCGRYLPGRCNGCGAAVDEPAARFCISCGKTLAA